MLPVLVRSSVSGLLGVAVMDLIINFPVFYLIESNRAVRREKSVHKYGRWAPEAAATLLCDRFFSVKLNNKESLIYGRMIHFGMGVAFANLYLPLLKKFGFIKKSAGLPLCFFLILFDELATYYFGFAAKPTRYPWQAHLRGMMSNTLQGLVIHHLLKTKA